MVAGSTLPRSKNQDAQEAMADLNVATNPALAEVSNIPEALRRYWIARRLDPSRMMLTADQIQATAGEGQPNPTAKDQPDAAGTRDISALLAAAGNEG